LLLESVPYPAEEPGRIMVLMEEPVVGFHERLHPSVKDWQRLNQGASRIDPIPALRYE
jgi:hypothetical protein